jgi:acyl-CoA synthetase (AMP-forming)/AMP-acid ligase II
MKSFFNDLECFSNSIVFSTKSEQITYEHLLKDIQEFSIHVKSRKLAFLLCENSIECVLGYLACLRAGVVPLLIGSSIDEEHLLNLIVTYHPNFIWVSRNSDLFNEKWKVIHSNRSYQLLERTDQFEHSFHPDLALLLMTSGSTGSPILVRVSYKNLIENANSISQSLGISQHDIPITTLPMNYTYGLSIINSHLLNGCQIVLTEESILSKNFWDLINAKRATTFSGVPYTFQMLRRLGFEKMYLPNISKITQAGGKLDLSMVKYFAEACADRGIQFFVMYGQTEATARMSCLPAKDALRKAGSIGVPISNGSFYLLDNVENVISVSDEVGELYYKGPNVSMGYANALSDFSKGDENEGVLATGDLAKMDEDGYYYIVGRKKRFIKIFGNRISLDEVENLSQKNGYSCVCTGKDDKLFIYTIKESHLKELKDMISSKIGIHHSAITVRYIPDFPRNDAGKILYSKLQVD